MQGSICDFTIEAVVRYLDTSYFSVVAETSCSKHFTLNAFPLSLCMHFPLHLDLHAFLPTSRPAMMTCNLMIDTKASSTQTLKQPQQL